MKINFMDKKMETTQELRDYAAKKVSKLDRLFRQESEGSVVFSRERGRYTAEVTVSNSRMIYRASETTGDLFASVDACVASIERQIRKNKDRLSKKLKAEPIVWNTGVAGEGEEESEELSILRSKHFTMEPMTPEEAVLQMDLLGHSFYAFRNMEEDGAFAVVYRREKGGYGLLCDGKAEE
ncbi:MAG: ribosome-associated translation inhibitor RaiA [Oscillospiraceae bacterium]|nr:ribosome-associated translation inhibitor RaiA [Oscillospiraceae bacterium]